MSVAATRRGTYAALGASTVVIGLVVHLGGRGVAPSLRDMLGDALWTAMMLWWVSVVAPRAPLWLRGALALAISFAVEASQLYRAPWLDAARSTLPGHLVLGSGYDTRDLAAYATGAAVAMWLDRVLMRAPGERKIAT